MRLPALESAFGIDLDRDLAIACADPTFVFTPLSRPESVQFCRCTQSERRHDWLRGRNALKQALGALGRDTDTSQIEFPNRHFSLTHAGGQAFCLADIQGSAGVGIDFEPLRRVNPKMARLFLNDTELRSLESCDGAGLQRDLVRLWTIKEAAFKSCPGNAGLVLQDFTITEPRSRISEVTVPPRRDRIRVAWRRHEAGYLSVALCAEQPA